MYFNGPAILTSLCYQQQGFTVISTLYDSKSDISALSASPGISLQYRQNLSNVFE